MAVHTYVILSTVVQGLNSDTNHNMIVTGTADGIPFTVQFPVSAITAFATAVQYEQFLKNLIDALLFPTAIPPPAITNGVTNFTL